MSLLGRITNALPRLQSITNNMPNASMPSTVPNRQGVGTVGVTMTTGNTIDKTRDLTDLQLVRPTIQNARRAVEMDPTTWSSLLSLTIMATKDDIEIVGDKDADEKAVQRIQKKVREWQLDTQMVSTVWKGLVDGRCFVENYIKPGESTISEVSHLAFDEWYYDFIDVVDPLTNELLGFKQKARIYPVPNNWENAMFDAVKNRMPEVKETTFTRQNGYIPVFMPKFFVGDGNSEGLVFKVLDDVYCLKTLKNMMPLAAKMAATTTGVKVGNKDFPFKPYNDSDPIEDKINKSETRMEAIGDNFKDKIKKEVILYDGGIEVGMVGDGKLPDFPSYNNFFKQEIRESLLTPDSRFSGTSSNRAVAQEQMSGSMGQVAVIDYIQMNYAANFYEKYIFDLELKLNSYDNDVGKVHISFGERETEDEVDLATIAQGILAIKPELFDVVVNEYYPRFAEAYSAYEPPEPTIPEDTVQTTLTNLPNPLTPENLPPEEAAMTNALQRGYRDSNKDMMVVEAAKQLLRESGVLI